MLIACVIGAQASKYLKEEDVVRGLVLSAQCPPGWVALAGNLKEGKMDKQNAIVLYFDGIDHRTKEVQMTVEPHKVYKADAVDAYIVGLAKRILENLAEILPPGFGIEQLLREKESFDEKTRNLIAELEQIVKGEEK